MQTSSRLGGLAKLHQDLLTFLGHLLQHVVGLDGKALECLTAAEYSG